mmetsp:Transcript_62353/g.177207  ORF Transcript_62353/g.177207 Transcript_62353/m.177207 type:complete len:293 (+) Transcript_62353:680-1558(+)
MIEDHSKVLPHFMMPSIISLSSSNHGITRTTRTTYTSRRTLKTRTTDSLKSKRLNSFSKISTITDKSNIFQLNILSLRYQNLRPCTNMRRTSSNAHMARNTQSRITKTSGSDELGFCKPHSQLTPIDKAFKKMLMETSVSNSHLDDKFVAHLFDQWCSGVFAWESRSVIVVRCCDNWRWTSDSLFPEVALVTLERPLGRRVFLNRWGIIVKYDCRRPGAGSRSSAGAAGSCASASPPAPAACGATSGPEARSARKRRPRVEASGNSRTISSVCAPPPSAWRSTPFMVLSRDC